MPLRPDSTELDSIRQDQSDAFGGIASAADLVAAPAAAAAGRVGGGLTINLNFDVSTGTAPPEFFTALDAAVQYFQTTFIDPITVTINVGWGEINSIMLAPGDLGESSTTLFSFSYSQIVQALRNDAKSPAQIQAASTLTDIDPTNGGPWKMAEAEAQALGLIVTPTRVDGAIGFNSTAPWTFDPNNRAVAGKYDFIGAAEHEISEALGRITQTGTFLPMDLFRYAGPGVRQLTTGDPSYFSIDGGVTNLKDWNNVVTGNPSGDLGDWATPAGAPSDAYNQSIATGVAAPVTDVDTLNVNILGFDIACFCRGTMILTEGGEVPVETLRVGDGVVTLSGAVKPIAWIGSASALVTRGNRLVWPVVIRRGALADNVPHRDLYLTHGHSLYFDGDLIPVENLVNHRSIGWDETPRAVEFFHLEFTEHEVLFAEGAPAESYREDGNRALFHNARQARGATNGRPAFAPVRNGGERVEAVWAALCRRAGLVAAGETTGDPDLHLAHDGRRIEPAAVRGGAYRFELSAAPTAALHLCSRSGVPSLLGVSRHDHRRLGVAIARIVLRQPGMVTVLKHDSPIFANGGCHAAEPGHSWTDGELTLPARLFAHLTGPFALTVRTEQPGMCYPVSAAVAAAA